MTPQEVKKLLDKLETNLQYQLNNIQRSNNNLRALYRNVHQLYEDVMILKSENK